MSELVDPRPRYLELISITDSHVILDPPIVFLFGGEIAEATEEPASIRDHLYRHLLENHDHLTSSLVIPEDFKDWLHDAAYPDLLTFESDLAQTASLVMIVLESAGAIAELGAFSMSPALKPKIQIVLRTHYHEQKSFICLGPLRQLNNDYIWPYPLENKDDLPIYLEDISTKLGDTLAAGDKTEGFDSENNGHIALLIFDLTLIYGALKRREIKSYLEILGLSRSDTIIKRLLFLLEKLDLVGSENVGGVRYYYPTSNENRLKYSNKDKKKIFDRSATKLEAATFYGSSTKEKLRHNLLKRRVKT